MPRLLLFAVCEKAIISAGENTPTLVGILNQLSVTIAPQGTGHASVGATGDKSPVAAIPFRWSAFALWVRDAGEENGRFQQTLKLVTPSGKVFSETTQQFVMEKPQHRIITNSDAFPVMESGEAKFELWVHRADDPSPAVLAGTYPFTVAMTIGQAPAPA